MSINLKSNIFYLFLLQCAQYILPLLTFPYLVRVLGVDGFGALAFCAATMAYPILVMEFGFGLTGTANVSKLRSDPLKLNEFFWAVFFSKILLGGGALLILILTTSLISMYDDLALVLIALIPMLIGNLLFPIWFFQGIEKMRYVTICSILGRVLTIPFVFVFVNSPGDIWIAALLQSSAFLLSGLIALIILKKDKLVGRVEYDRKAIMTCMKDGWHVFLSTASVNLYTSSTPIILGFIAGTSAVAYFKVAETIVNAFKGLMRPVFQSVFPRLAYSFTVDVRESMFFLRKLLKITCAVSFLFTVVAIGLSEQLVGVLAGEDYGNSVNILIILSLTILISSINNIIGVQTLLPLGYKKQFSEVLLFSGLVSFLLSFTLSYLYEGVGAALAIVLTELVVFSCLLVICGKNGVRYFRFN